MPQKGTVEQVRSNKIEVKNTLELITLNGGENLHIIAVKEPCKNQLQMKIPHELFGEKLFLDVCE